MTGVLLDQGLPRSAARILRDSGFDAVHVGEIGMSAAADVTILSHARESNLGSHSRRGLSRNPCDDQCDGAFRDSYPSTTAKS